MRNLITLFFSSLFFVLSVVCQGSGVVPCPHWRLLGSDKIKDGELGYEPLKWVTINPSLCFENRTKTFSRAFTNVFLHQTNEGWNKDPHARKQFVLSEIEDAINAGLGLFGDHAGNETNPLKIDITIADAITAGPISQYPGEENIVHNRDVTFNTWGYLETPGIATSCELLVGWPYNRSEPLTRLKKNIVKNMFHCVQQYHHPRVPWNSGARPWWHQSIARFFDGLLWPSPQGWSGEIADGKGFWDTDGYPEQYSGFHSLAASRETGALFWHWAYNSGWSPERITEWMKARFSDYRGDSVSYYGAFDFDAADMSRDPDICALFHSFGRAVGIDNVTYPVSGTKISGRTGWTPTPWKREVLYTPKSLERGEERDISGIMIHWPANKDIGAVYLVPWEITVLEVEFEKGQVLDVSIGHRDYVQRVIKGRETNFTIDRVNNASIYDDVRFSYRADGEVNLELMEGGEARIAVPEGQPLTRYQFFSTCTGATYDYAPLEVKVRRVF
ncbi:hypothetical protein OQA88_5828 [Cercophora sp. LCS_1]